MVRAFVLLLALVGAPILGACGSQPLTVTLEPVSIRLAVAESCAPLAEALAAAYEAAHPWATLELASSNSTLATEALIDGEADMALVPWVSAEAVERGVWTAPIGRTGIAIVANPSLELANLHLGHLHEMYRGRLQDWNGHVLVVVSREEGSGTRAAFEQAVLRGREMSALTAVMLPSTQAVLDYVASTPEAVGYVATVYLGGSLAEQVRVTPVDGAMPTRAAVADGSYPLWGPLLLAANGEPTGAVRDWAQWVLSPVGQEIVARFGSW